jgi:hypothetical protein
MASIQLSPHQAFMLKMFADGWGFKMYNDKPGSWNTYWSLRRRGLIGSGPTVKTSTNLVAKDRLTPSGRKALEQYLEKQKGRINGADEETLRAV